MSRILIQSASIILAITVLNPPAYGNQNSNLAASPSIVGAVQFPKRKLSYVRHTIRIEVPEDSKAISQLKISVPPGLTVSNNITIHDESEENITADISVAERMIIISFSQPITPKNRLEINMNGVRISGASNVFTYRVIAKLVDIEPELNLGIAEIRTSR
ncbi:hypothetical protein C7H19_20985 [Aphanothece hegewaldii CCALA 016]|uniref:DUF2808 domain-containing protein n=1 Tax=Aphanothece hegewaldii CCALA 016 TaxID=2107694 RepID=A0A2T1LSQ4_9CHRO|nr:DUF2808 domain-containing protein [Aphanothece hegewaldii]PSF32921.1 hypothetical protein C7H19_20985 [Aphanothece hegewaldii CCALA 016]